MVTDFVIISNVRDHIRDLLLYRNWLIKKSKVKIEINNPGKGLLIPFQM